MVYPERLLPQRHFNIIDFNSTNTSLRYLVRHTDATDISDGEGLLRPEVVSTDESYNHLRDFSTNLLGVFEVEDIHVTIRNNEEYFALWDIGSEPLIPVDEHCEIVEQRACIFLPIADCHLVSFKAINQIEGEAEIFCKVLHTPTRSNFWHCSLRWYYNEEGSESWNKGRMRRMKANMRSFICERAEITEPIYQSIDESAYNVYAE
ncbi:hypothetical protein LZD49_15120 [Dyadobacter sp. CY261]|nr:hypothetical protein [Dyadobacter sp. CY261]